MRLSSAARAIALLAAAGALAAAIVAWRGARTDEQPVRLERLYALALPDADGRTQPLAQWRGKTLVVNFWATWCEPCVTEMPELDRVQREFARRNVTILGIGVEAPLKVREFRDRLGLQMPLLAGGIDSLALARAFGDPEGVLPYTAVFSSDGRLLHSQVGALAPGELRSWLVQARPS